MSASGTKSRASLTAVVNSLKVLFRDKVMTGVWLILLIYTDSVGSITYKRNLGGYNSSISPSLVLMMFLSIGSAESGCKPYLCKRVSEYNFMICLIKQFAYHSTKRFQAGRGTA